MANTLLFLIVDNALFLAFVQKNFSNTQALCNLKKKNHKKTQLTDFSTFFSFFIHILIYMYSMFMYTTHYIFITHVSTDVCIGTSTDTEIIYS